MTPFIRIKMIRMKTLLFALGSLTLLPLQAQIQNPFPADTLSTINLEEVLLNGIRAKDDTPVTFTNVTKEEIAARFNAEVADLNDYEPMAFCSAFYYPKTPVITNEAPTKVQLFNWGLIPRWAEDDAIKSYLVEKGIEGSRLTVVGYGDEKPDAGADTNQAKAQNRRVEFSATK